MAKILLFLFAVLPLLDAQLTSMSYAGEEERCAPALQCLDKFVQSTNCKAGDNSCLCATTKYMENVETCLHHNCHGDTPFHLRIIQKSNDQCKGYPGWPMSEHHGMPICQLLPWGLSPLRWESEREDRNGWKS
ncbi:hypothetical protein EJ08DRAFT_681656 [Tothia fuscella]|uniref:CFEM domain-containing protein n=1 Tax=Tothia fuscella TaxID=1048955 RepID=A0A9P4TUM2_9PEZI|nr:hypothetical protein EJ08DRAFT_681656 [Tothia fuscella]